MKTIAILGGLAAGLWVLPAQAAEDALVTDPAMKPMVLKPMTEPATEPVMVHVKPSERVGFSLHLGLSLGAGVVSVPLGLGLATWLGSLSNSLFWSALPALLSMGFVAPTLTTLAAWLIGNWESPDRFGFWLPWAASCAVNIVALIVGGFAGVTVGIPAQLILFSLIDGVLVGGASVGAMRLWARRADDPLASFAPGISPTHVVALGKVSF